MSGKIYWGRPGSYKTSSAIKTDLPEFAFEGRKVITNVRGLNDTEQIKKVLEKQFKKQVHDDFEIINVESETKEGRDKWARFFHWCPKGAAFIVDEAQDVWSKRWTTKQLDSFNYPGGPDKANEDGRPNDFSIAFDQHRHYNWDFVLTTPHIKKLREDIREICDFAYKHRNQALVGLSKRYNQFGHDPDNNCRSEKDAEVSRIGCSIPSWVFDLYESTATGEISDTRSGFKFWKQPKIMILLLLFVLSWGYALFHVDDLIEHYKRAKNPDIKTEAIAEGETVTNGKVIATRNRYFDDLSNLNLYYAGKIGERNKLTYLFMVETSEEKEGTLVDGTFIESMGYGIVEINNNMVLVGNETEKYYIKTKGIKNDKKMF